MKRPEDLPMVFRREGVKDLPDGRFMIPHPKIKGYIYHIIFSTGLGWEHLSVSLVKIVPKLGTKTLKAVERCCTWEEMCFLKDMFWAHNECVVQYHPPMSQYINNHAWVLHLWKPTEATMPAPDAVMGGVNSEELNQMMAVLKERFPGLEVEKYYEAIYMADAKDFKENREDWLEETDQILLLV